MDTFDRWCLFCDFELHPTPTNAPQPVLVEYVDDLINLVDQGEAKRIFEHQSRVTRIAHANRIELPDGSAALAMVVTLGDRRGADPAFVNFEHGAARAAEKLEGEVKGASAHCIIRLTPDADDPRRHRMLLEEVRGIGRTPVTRLISTTLKAVAENRNERFRNPDSGRMNNCRPGVEVHPRRSREMAEALDNASFFPVELFDTRPVPAFDENPEFSVRRHQLTVKVRPAPGRSLRQAFADLKEVARQNGYNHMRISWRLPGDHRGGSTEMATDLADVGTALFAHRELIHIPSGLSECCDRLHDEFVGAMSAQFDEGAGG